MPVGSVSRHSVVVVAVVDAGVVVGGIVVVVVVVDAVVIVGVVDGVVVPARVCALYIQTKNKVFTSKESHFQLQL